MTSVIGLIRDATLANVRDDKYGNTLLTFNSNVNKAVQCYASSRSVNIVVCRAARRFRIESEIPVSVSGSKKVTHVCYIVSRSVELKPASLSAN